MNPASEPNSVLGGAAARAASSPLAMNVSGNNPIITGDMARRAIPLDIVPASADPERVRYGFDPVAFIRQQIESGNEVGSAAV